MCKKAYLIILFITITYLPYSKPCIPRAKKKDWCVEIDKKIKITHWQKCNITSPELTGITENKCTTKISPNAIHKDYMVTSTPTIAKCVLRESSELIPAPKTNCTKELQNITCSSDCVVIQACLNFEKCFRGFKVLLECVNSTEKDVLRNPQPDIQGLLFSKSKIPIVNRTLFNMSSNIKIFRAANNQIETIDDNAFQALKNLTLVDVSNNKLKRISPNLFKKNCMKMRNFYANNNPELVIPYNGPILHSLQLEQLHLQECNIEKLSASNFQNLPGLLKLNLARNNIKVLPEDVFTPLKNLWWLDLSGNKLRTISLSAFANVRPPLVLLVKGNPWECGCSLYPMIEYSRTRGHYTDDVTCVKPSRNKKWKDVTLKCPTPKKRLSKTY